MHNENSLLINTIFVTFVPPTDLSALDQNLFNCSLLIIDPTEPREDHVDEQND